MDTAEKLLPCPFCGNDAVIYEWNDLVTDKHWYRPQCSRCNCIFDNGWYNGKDAAKEWNDRLSSIESKERAARQSSHDESSSKLGEPAVAALPTELPEFPETWQEGIERDTEEGMITTNARVQMFMQDEIDDLRSLCQQQQERIKLLEGDLRISKASWNHACHDIDALQEKIKELEKEVIEALRERNAEVKLRQVAERGEGK